MSMRTVPSNGTPGRRKTRLSNGFTLVEVIIALALAGLAISVLTGSYMQSAYMQKLLEGRITALIIGESKLAELEVDGETASSGDFPVPYSGYKWTTQEEPVDDGSTQIVVTVEWGDGHASARHQKVFQGRRLPK